MIRRPPRSTLSLHDALPIFPNGQAIDSASLCVRAPSVVEIRLPADLAAGCTLVTTGRLEKVTGAEDRKSTRLNSSHANISYAVFCLKKKNYFFHPLTTLMFF